MWHTNILNHRVSVCMVAKPFHKTWGTYSGKQSLQLWRFSVLGKKKGTGGRGGLLKNSFLQDILWSFSAWLTEGLISSWVCNCGSFCSMSAIADLINKVLWQCTVYFQGLDLRAESSGVGYSLPHIHSRRHTNMHVWWEVMLLNDKAGFILYFSFCDQIPWKYQYHQIDILPLHTSWLPPTCLWLSAPSPCDPMEDISLKISHKYTFI